MKLYTKKNRITIPMKLLRSFRCTMGYFFDHNHKVPHHKKLQITFMLRYLTSNNIKSNKIGQGVLGIFLCKTTQIYSLRS